MLLTVDLSLREILNQCLEHYSVHTLLYTLGEIERADDPETFADMANKLLPNYKEV